MSDKSPRDQCALCQHERQYHVEGNWTRCDQCFGFDEKCAQTAGWGHTFAYQNYRLGGITHIDDGALPKPMDEGLTDIDRGGDITAQEYFK